MTFRVTRATIFLFLLPSGVPIPECDLEDKQMVQAKFRDCTLHYKSEYDEAASMGHEEIEEMTLTCWLVEKLVNTCGDLWARCYAQEDVEKMKGLHVESLLSKTRNASVDIGNCDTIKKSSR